MQCVAGGPCGGGTSSFAVAPMDIQILLLMCVLCATLVLAMVLTGAIAAATFDGIWLVFLCCL